MKKYTGMLDFDEYSNAKGSVNALSIKFKNKKQGEICWEVLVDDKYCGMIKYFPFNKKYKIIGNVKNYELYYMIEEKLQSQCNDYMIEEILLLEL